MPNKHEVYYAVRNLVFKDRLVVKEGMEVTVLRDNGKMILFGSPTVDGQLPHEMFRTIFSKFRPNEIVFHTFYGIGQVVPSKKAHITSAVQFFSEPGQLFDIDDDVLLESSLSRMPGIL